MDPLAAAVRAFQARFRAFRRRPGAAMLRVVTDVANVGTLLPVVALEEWAPSNRTPFVVLDAPCDDGELPFARLSALLAERYAAIPCAAEVAAAPPPPLADAAEPVAAFGALLRALVACTAGVAEPPLFCWLPADVRSERAYRYAVHALLAHAVPLGARVVALDRPHEAWLADFGTNAPDRVLAAPFAVDDAAQREYFKKLVLAPPSAGRARGTPPGAAAPDVVPPPRPGPQPPTDEQVRATIAAAGLPPVLTAGEGEQLRALTFGAAVALAEQRTDEALAQQFAAYQLCGASGVLLEQALMALVLASYLVQLGREDAAEQWYRESARLAEAAGRPAQAAQARLGLGYLLLSARRHAEAAAVYMDAAAAAVAGAAPLLAIEAGRLAGHGHVRARNADAAIRCWTATVEYACSLPPADVGASSLAEVVDCLRRALAARGARQEQARLDDAVRALAPALAQPRGDAMRMTA